MGIASQNDGHFVTLTQSENFQVVGTGIHLATGRFQRAVVDFQQRATFLRCQDHWREIQLGRAISRMTDNLNVRMADDLHHTIGVFFHCSVFVTKQVNAGYTDVQTFHQRFIGIEGSLPVKDVDFGT